MDRPEDHPQENLGDVVDALREIRDELAGLAPLPDESRLGHEAIQRLEQIRADPDATSSGDRAFLLRVIDSLVSRDPKERSDPLADWKQGWKEGHIEGVADAVSRLGDLAREYEGPPVADWCRDIRAFQHRLPKP